MSKKIVIVESDAPFSKRMKEELASHSFNVVETPDGKGAADLCRKENPDLIVLAVELAAGQSGYLVCGKLKKDDELKRIPVVIIGKDAKGFDDHRKLKTRAEEYLKKPFEPDALLAKVGGLIGLPEMKVDDELVVDDGLSLGSIEEEAVALEDVQAEEVEGTLHGDPDLDMLDEAFESMSTKPGKGGAPPPLPKKSGSPTDPEAAVEDDLLAGLEVPADIVPQDEPTRTNLSVSEADEDSALSTLGAEDLSIDIETETKPTPTAPPFRERRSAPPPPVNDAEVQQLRSKVSELEEKIGQLEGDVASKDADLAVARATGASTKDASALKDTVLKKDKEILRLKQELNEKETELVEIKEKESQLEAAASEHAGEVAKRDAQTKSLQQKVDQLQAEKKKSDAAATQAKDEARASAASLATAQGELDQAHDHITDLTGQLDDLKVKSAELTRQADAARAETAEARAKAQSDLAGITAELETLRSDMETSKAEMDRLRTESGAKLHAQEEEANQLRARISDLEQGNAKNEDRIVKAYQKIKSDEKLREKTRKAIAVALQLMDEQSSAAANMPLDETHP